MNNEELLNIFQKSIGDCVAMMSTMSAIIENMREVTTGSTSTQSVQEIVEQSIAPLVLRIAELESAMPAVSYEQLADHLDYERLAEQVDAEEVASYTDAEDIAQHVDAADVAQYVDAADIAMNIPVEELSAHLDVETVVRDALRNL